MNARARRAAAVVGWAVDVLLLVVIGGAAWVVVSILSGY